MSPQTAQKKKCVEKHVLEKHVVEKKNDATKNVSASHKKFTERMRVVHKLKKEPRSHYIMTSRFSTNNHAEMRDYCLKKNFDCIYGSYTPISATIPLNAIMFVLEMNNDKNRIEGIGLARNLLSTNPHYIYQEEAYNTFTYIGTKHIARDEMTPEEDIVIDMFDYMCFKSKQHLKRGRGITLFPIDYLENLKEKIDMYEFFRQMFIKRLKQKNT
jgi:hypothetical protein